MKMKMSRWLGLLLLILALIGASSTRIEARQVRSWPTWATEGDSHVQATRAVQYLLRARGYKIAVDGVFGRQTESALKKFQSARKLDANGIMDGAVWEVLVVRVRRGNRGDAVRAAQSLLRSKGYQTKVDGVFGTATEKAARRFQKSKDKDLVVDGIVGLDTWCELFGGTIETMSEE